MPNSFKTFLLGKPLETKKLASEKLNTFWGLPIMASDAISSVAYAVEEILWVLIPVVGLLAYQDMFYTAIAIVFLLLILVFSYRQTIDSYPHGGGSYTVAKENLGELPGLAAASSLTIGYILTVAVSTSAGTAAITSALPELLPYTVLIALTLIALMMVANLRGVRDSARIFAFPTYLFIIAMLIMIVTGIVKVVIFGQSPESLETIPNVVGDLTLFLMVRAFAAGCAGLTGIEAVSNAVPTFTEPSQKHAKQVLSLLALFVVLIFGGASFLATLYHAVPSYDVTVLSQIATQVFGDGFMFYALQVLTAVILIMAANTSFAGLPMLLSLLARDGYAPRQFGTRGGRLGFSNGIIALSVAAALLVIIYRGQTHDLVPLYAIGVFISFTLSQVGMLAKWFREKSPKWQYKAIINGIGAVMSTVTVVIIAYSKMADGAWIAIVLMVAVILVMKKSKSHYQDVANQLHLEPDQVKTDKELIEVIRHTIVIVDSLNKASMRAINYARRISNDTNVMAFNVSLDVEKAKYLRNKWKICKIPIPLVIRYSAYREVVASLMKYLGSEEHDYLPGDMITVVMPQFIVSKSWMNLFHNQTGLVIRNKLLHDRHIAVVTVPYVLDKKPAKPPEQS